MFKINCNKCDKEISINPFLDESKYAGNGIHYCNDCFEELGLKESKIINGFSVVSFLLKIVSTIWIISILLSNYVYDVELWQNPKFWGMTMALLLIGLAVIIDKLGRIVHKLESKE